MPLAHPASDSSSRLLRPRLLCLGSPFALAAAEHSTPALSFTHTPEAAFALAALTVLYRPEEFPAHLRRARDNGLSNDEISALITHCAFYGGFPAAISASMLAAETLL